MLAYSKLLENLAAPDGRLQEVGKVLELPDELHLQALWFAGQMGREFQTVDGKSVKIIQFGHWNHGAGPDFLHSAVEIDGELQTGALELDHRASDWEAHGHSVNEAFNGVILHVVFAADTLLTRNSIFSLSSACFSKYASRAATLASHFELFFLNSRFLRMMSFIIASFVLGD